MNNNNQKTEVIDTFSEAQKFLRKMAATEALPRVDMEQTPKANEDSLAIEAKLAKTDLSVSAALTFDDESDRPEPKVVAVLPPVRSYFGGVRAEHQFN